jgi:hypothetical protein
MRLCGCPAAVSRARGRQAAWFIAHSHCAFCNHSAAMECYAMSTDLLLCCRCCAAVPMLSCCCCCCCAAGEAAKETAEAVGAKASSAAAAVKEGLSEARQQIKGGSNTASDKARTWFDAVQVCTCLSRPSFLPARTLQGGRARDASAAAPSTNTLLLHHHQAHSSCCATSH